MNFTLATGDFNRSPSDCLVIGIFENKELSATAKKIDKFSKGYLSHLLKQGDITGSMGESFLIYVPELKKTRVLLIGCGKKQTLKTLDYRRINFTAAKALLGLKTREVTFFLAEIAVDKKDLAWKIKHAVEAISNALYQFNEFKSEKKIKPSLSEISFNVDKISKPIEKALLQGQTISEGVNFVKNIANMPSNICTPSYLAKEAQTLAKKYKKIKVKVLGENEMKKLGMGALLAVSSGSQEEAKLISLEYKGDGKKAPIALVGKGVTFDTGGISLKPADGMIGMKYDMCGAATVLGVLKIAAELKLPLNIVGVIPTVENMPSGSATKPEDIVTTLSGQTVEILNTDAEGRLILCDALTYCERFKPDTVIDIATLTGAVVIALGHHASGLLANDDKLAQDLLNAGVESTDRAWQLPLWEDYQEQLKSPFADMTNVGGRVAGVITAACFLSRFAKKFRWAHLDVAGTAAMMGGNDRYATGRPVPLLMQYLFQRAKVHA